MLKKAALSFLFFLLLAAASLWYYCFHVLPRDLQEYEKELKSKQAHYHLQKNTSPCFAQHRTGIKKDMWIYTSDCTEHHRLEAALGTLIVKKLDNTWDMQEHLQDVTCLLDSPSHELKLIKTKKGVYHYKTKNFSSPQVHLFYLNSSQTAGSLPVATLQAQAFDVGFSLNAPELSFSAKHLVGHTQKSAQ